MGSNPILSVYFCKKRVSVNGKRFAFQAETVSSILTTRKYILMTIHSNQSSIQTANHILLYFFRYGNKENIEVSLRKFRIKRAKKIHNSTISSTINKEENIQLRQQLKANKLFNTFSHTVIPFLTLKTKNIQKKLEDAKIFPLTP